MPYWIETGSALRLAIAPRPRGGDWLEDDLRALKRDNVDILVSLLTPEENQELGLVDEDSICRTVGIDFRSFPIPDRHTPQSTDEFVSFIDSLREETDKGRSVAAHCRAGIGRSSVTVASIMVREGLNPHDAFYRISKARGLNVPDTPEQIAWVNRLGNT